MKRLILNSKGEYVFEDWIPMSVEDFGPTCVKIGKYVEDKVRINNNEVSTGTSRTALYTMPGGVDNGVRYSPLYESSGLDITEIEANKNALKNALDKVSDMVKDEFEKISTETANKLSMSQKSSQTNDSSSNSSQS